MKIELVKEKDKKPDKCNTNNNHQSHGEQKKTKKRWTIWDLTSSRTKKATIKSDSLLNFLLLRKHIIEKNTILSVYEFNQGKKQTN